MNKKAKIKNYIEKLSGYFENLKGYKNEDVLMKDIQSVKEREEFEDARRKQIADNAPRRKEVVYLNDPKKVKKRERLNNQSEKSKNISAITGLGSILTGGIGFENKIKPLKAIGAAGAVGSLGLLGASKYMDHKADKMNIKEKKTIEVPEVDWSKRGPEIKQKAKKKYPSQGGQDFGMLGKYVTVSPNTNYGKKDGKYRNVYSGEEYDKPYVTRKDLKKARKTYKGMDERTVKIIDKALESDNKVFTSTKTY